MISFEELLQQLQQQPSTTGTTERIMIERRSSRRRKRIDIYNGLLLFGSYNYYYNYCVLIPFLLLLLLVIMILMSSTTTIVVAAVETTTTTTNDGSSSFPYLQTIQQHLELFHYSEELHVLGPTRFPKPSEIYLDTNDNEDNTKENEYIPYLQPIYGIHRPTADAIVAFAAEYPLLNYISFIETLRISNYTGDIVLCISPYVDVTNKDVWTYLTNANDDKDDGLNVILYAPKLTCYNAEHEQVDTSKGGSRICYAHNIYGKYNKITNITSPLQDVRIPRTVQTLRYELYWIMCQSYNKYSWIFVVDVRDTVFQANPFATVPRRKQADTNQYSGGGIIYMFGENVDATRLGKSEKNRKWLLNSYGEKVGTQWLAAKPTICSGATMGEWIAMETYLRAMVDESDTTEVTLPGADQGFHNYIHYSHKLKSSITTIASIVVFDQGYGIVNNMGALRTKSLEEWGNGQILRTIPTNETNPKKIIKYVVQNWDGQPSPVVHQFDRHKYISNYFFKQQGQHFVDKWQQRLKQNNNNNNIKFVPIPK